MRFDKNSIRRGMTAISTKGQKLGKVIQCDDETFVVEKGVLFHKDYRLYYDYVADIRGDELRYALDDSRVAGRDADDAKADVQAKRPGRLDAEERPLRSGQPVTQPVRMEERGAAARPIAEPIGGGEHLGRSLRSEEPIERSAFREARAARTAERGADEGEMRIPLMDEEIAVEKVARETGHVRIHKGVRIEEKHLKVPVRREEVVIERLPGREASLAGAGADAFKEQTLDLPVHEEEVRVTKHAVMREELRVRRTAHEEQREATATLRHEEAEIEDTTPAGRRSVWQEPAAMSASAHESGRFKKG